MNKKNLMITALLLSLCATASLTSCGRTNTNDTQNGNNGERVTTTPAEPDRKETDNGIVGGIESGLEDMGNDIKNSIGNPEYATHEKTKDAVEYNGESKDYQKDQMTPNMGAKHRQAVPNGK